LARAGFRLAPFCFNRDRQPAPRWGSMVGDHLSHIALAVRRPKAPFLDLSGTGRKPFTREVEKWRMLDFAKAATAQKSVTRFAAKAILWL